MSSEAYWSIWKQSFNRGGSPLLSLVILMTQFVVFVTDVLSEGDEPMYRKFHVSLSSQGECAMWKVSFLRAVDWEVAP